MNYSPIAINKPNRFEPEAQPLPRSCRADGLGRAVRQLTGGVRKLTCKKATSRKTRFCTVWRQAGRMICEQGSKQQKQ